MLSQAQLDLHSAQFRPLLRAFKTPIKSFLLICFQNLLSCLTVAATSYPQEYTHLERKNILIQKRDDVNGKQRKLHIRYFPVWYCSQSVPC